jgi:hypothetical protein
VAKTNTASVRDAHAVNTVMTLSEDSLNETTGQVNYTNGGRLNIFALPL